jgi:hypothetical protein
MNGPTDVMIQTEGNHEMDANSTGYSNSTGIDGDLVDFIILSGWPTRIPDGKAMFTEKIDMSVTE